MIGIIGKKLGMTQIFNEQGQQIPCTVVEATPNAVTQVLTTEVAGVSSVQLGYGEQKLARENKKGEKTPRGRRANKAVVGHAAKAGAEWQRIVEGAALARAAGLEVHAGHGLDYQTAETIAALPEIAELNIGYFMMGEALFVGLGATVRSMRAAMDRGRQRSVAST